RHVALAAHSDFAAIDAREQSLSMNDRARARRNAGQLGGESGAKTRAQRRQDAPRWRVGARKRHEAADSCATPTRQNGPHAHAGSQAMGAVRAIYVPTAPPEFGDGVSAKSFRPVQTPAPDHLSHFALAALPLAAFSYGVKRDVRMCGAGSGLRGQPPNGR